MTVRIGSNIASLQAQRRLSQSTSELSSIYEKLSSGKRINKASDDAAGLAIAESLNTDKRKFDQAVRNGNDALSLLSIAEEANKQLSGIATRIAELAEQSANGVYSSTQRQALDSEAQALRSEFARIIDTTEFNNLKLLDGSVSTVDIQIGINGARESILKISTGAAQNSYTWDGTLSQTGSYPFTNRVSYVELADLNRDGNLDALYLSDSGGSLNVMMGNGDGTFGTAVSYGGTGVDIETADFDEDGDLDVMARQGGALRLYRNDGSGALSSSVIALVNSPQSNSYADINGDGHLDVIAIDDNAETIIAALGNGNGTFQAMTTFTPGGMLEYAAYADLNGDGRDDLVVTGPSSNYYVGLSNGDGTFNMTSLGVAPYATTLPTLGDLNNDGNLDLILTAGASNPAYYRYGNGDGTFQASAVLLPTNVQDNPIVLDMNNDGYNDLFVQDAGASQVRIYTGSASGAFTLASQTSVSVAAMRDTAAGDINGDGVADFLIAGFTANQTVVIESGSTGSTLMPAVSLDTAAAARTTLDSMRETISTLGQTIGRIGADRSRVVVAINNLMSSSLETSAAESRLRDVDIAAESANATRETIKQKIASAILAQANQAPDLALLLLRNR